MRSLVELQETFAHAMTSGEGAALVAELTGGTHPAGRLAVHLRHYAASLTAALGDNFPACAWLAGADLVREAARAYVRAHPPHEPCIAEYGCDFPGFLATYGRAPALPYLESFAALEWAVGHASIAIDRPSLAWADLSRFGPEGLLDLTLALQPGLRYLRSDWSVDELMTMYLSGAEPERFVLGWWNAHIEVRGARGEVRLTRLDGGAFRFRAELLAGQSIGDAAARALESATAFDAGAALRELAHAGLVTGARAAVRECGQ